MSEKEQVAATLISEEEIRKGWHELTLRVAQLETEKISLEQEIKSLRFLLERVVEHRQKSHSELILLLTGLVSKLPLNDVGVIVSKLVEHNTTVGQTLAAFLKGTPEAELPQPMLLKQLDQIKQELLAAFKPAVEDLLQLDAPLENELLRSLVNDPELFFSPRMARGNRCFLKGHVPRERVVRDFGDAALVFFNDMTTDAKLNPRPKPEEIALAFKDDFETLFQQQPDLIPSKRQDLLTLYRQVQRTKTPSEARAQKNAFLRLSFFVELLHFYGNQNTEAPDALFAQRLPSITEQLVLSGGQESLDEKLLQLAESLLGYIIRPEHRQMVINNIGKSGGIAKTLRYVLRLRADRIPDDDPEQIIADFVKHLLQSPAQRTPAGMAGVLKLVSPEMQRLVLRFLLRSEKIQKQEAESLIKSVGGELGLKELPQSKAYEGVPVEIERQIAWANIAALIARRTDAGAVAAAIRDRLHDKYDAEEIRQSWMTLIEADAISLIRIFSQIPYLANGKTDPIARTVMETYVSRLTHEKYTGIYQKVVNSLRNMFAAKPDSPTLLNFVGLVRWISPEAANKLSTDIGMPAPAQ